jgi:hypothetical protein
MASSYDPTNLAAAVPQQVWGEIVRKLQEHPGSA